MQHSVKIWASGDGARMDFVSALVQVNPSQQDRKKSSARMRGIARREAVYPVEVVP